MSGQYIRTETNAEIGLSSDADWYVTSCGDGCASVAGTPGGPAVQARLVNGRWTMDEEGNAALCLDGSVVPNSETSHYTWDPYTLAGTYKSPKSLRSSAHRRRFHSPTPSN
jgi:hypothetical protein